MRQPTTHLRLCLKCDRGEFRNLPPGAAAVPCPHCGGETVERYALIVPLTTEQRNLLKATSAWTRTKTDDVLARAIVREFRRVATDRAQQNKPIPQWAADWMQKNKEV